MNKGNGTTSGAAEWPDVAGDADRSSGDRPPSEASPSIDTVLPEGLRVHHSGMSDFDSAANDLLPWDVYRFRRGVFSASRMLLSEALTAFCALQWDIDAGSIADAFQASTVDEDDLIELTSSVDFLAQLILDESIKCWSRPFGGGLPAKVPAVHWEIDDFLPRFATSAFNPLNWHSTAAVPTHWLFVDVVDFERFMNEWEGTDRSDAEEFGEKIASASPTGLADASEFIRLAAVIRMTSLSRSTVYQKISAKTFPEPTRLGTRLSMWRRSHIEAWLRDPR